MNRRLAEGGLIDRSVAVPFRFDGRAYSGHPGDTLASALLASGQVLFGRSFKYHRPRGLFSAGSEEPNALAEVGEGSRRSPNTRATTKEIYPGLVAVSQNRWPSLRLDLLAVNDWLAPFLGAGFYYKTFMWPPAWWERVYEPLIRRAAGLGHLSGLAETGHWEKAWDHCDLLVIGAGPAGLQAALTAARWGARVILADEDFLPGGRLNSENLTIGDQPAAQWARSAAAELEGLPNVRLMRRTTVTGAYDHGTYGAIERVSDHLAFPGRRPEQCFWRIVARRVVLAAGATERPIAFAGNDRPGVMLAGAMRTYVLRYAVAPAGRVAIFTNNDDGHRSAEVLHGAGVEVVALIDSRKSATTGLPCRFIAGGRVTATRGRQALSAIQVQRADGRVEWIACDGLGVSGGWNPNLHLSSHLGARPQWDEALAAFLPLRGAVPGMEAAGAAGGVFSTHGALAGGEAAARAALEFLGRKVARSELPRAEDAPVRIEPLWQVPGRGRAWVDLQNDVTTRDIAQAHAENFRAPEHLKRYTTLGMATDQGRTANVNALAVIAGLSGESIAASGTTTFRPPYAPVAIAAMGAGGAGRGFAPERTTPAHGLAVERRAPMLEAGLWLRAAYFPQAGDSGWRAACDREVGHVRNAVGICDISTLGKIDIQGPDAALLLDRVYANNFATLKPGRLRYGLMLREDGFVMDDGTCTRLGDQHFLMTTTSSGAEAVLAHLEFCAQVLWPEMDVQITPVTDHWAQFAVAGPLSRRLLAGVVAEPVADADLPHMACLPVTAMGVKGRLFRISFSGERGYELAVPGRYARALMHDLITRAEGLGGGAYGLEALNVLRIEKGHPTSAEFDGRVTAGDCGLGRLLAPGKDFIGKVMAGREALVAPSRGQLVGLVPEDREASGPLAGAHLAEPDQTPGPAGDLGHVSSACFSPTLGHHIALAFLKDGRQRLGDLVRACDPLRGQQHLCRVVAPVFHDPEGGRLHG